MIFMIRTGGQPPPPPQVRYLSLIVPDHLQDENEIAQYLRNELDIPMLFLNVRKDAEQNITFAFGTHTGGQRVTLLRNENRARIEVTRRDVGHFIGMMHATAQTDAADWRVRLWGFYVEFSIWCLIAMAATGCYLWLSSRPRFVWAQFAFVSGSGVFLLLWFLTR
jgi:hypothetical protein